MLKKIFLLAIFIFVSSCGYKAIHSLKNNISYDFSISELSFEGDRDINLKIKEKLNNYTLSEKEKDFILKISSNSQKNIIAKDGAGDPTGFKNIITVKIEILNKGKTQSSLLFVEDFSYNNDSNKFNLKRYEKEIKNNLAGTVTDKLTFKLSNIK